ncbi:MAG: YkvA family protein [Polyangiaceae bacterium]
MTPDERDSVEDAEDIPEAGVHDRRRAATLLRRLTSRARHHQLETLRKQRQAMFEKLHEIPSRMQKLTNQVRLLLELVDDYWEGRYRKVRWFSLGVAVAAALYFLSPTDLIPDTLPGIGHLDDVIVMALALRVLRKELRSYCEFKGKDPDAYF